MTNIDKAIVITLKSLGHTKHRIEHKGTDDGRRPETLYTEYLGQGLIGLTQLVPDIVANTVKWRNRTGHHGAVGRERNGNR